MGTFIPFLNAVKSSVSIVFLTLIISLTTTVHHGIAENVYSNVSTLILFIISYLFLPHFFYIVEF